MYWRRYPPQSPPLPKFSVQSPAPWHRAHLPAHLCCDVAAAPLVTAVKRVGDTPISLCFAAQLPSTAWRTVPSELSPSPGGAEPERAFKVSRRSNVPIKD